MKTENTCRNCGKSIAKLWSNAERDKFQWVHNDSGMFSCPRSNGVLTTRAEPVGTWKFEAL